MRRRIAALAVVISLAMGTGGLGASAASGHWETYCSPDLNSCWQEFDPWKAPTLVGDDNGDGVIDEDESGWNCRTMGNRICGDLS